MEIPVASRALLKSCAPPFTNHLSTMKGMNDHGTPDGLPWGKFEVGGGVEYLRQWLGTSAQSSFFRSRA